MLTAANAEIVRATLPVVGEHLDAITATFYDTMLAERPELRDLFSRSAQASGEQRRALAAAVAGFATALVSAEADVDVLVGRIAHRHASLGITPQQYTMVGRYLLGAVGAVLGEAVTPAVAAAWDEVYWLFAVRLIGLESRLYTRAGVEADEPWREYTVARRHADADDTVSLILVPADGGSAPHFDAGQYVTVAVRLPDGGRQLRQYSLSQAPGGAALRVTVRRVPGGLVSGFLHDNIGEGDRLTLSAPYGDLTLRPGASPLVLVSAGVGITPMAAILDHVARTQPNREVVAVHAERGPGRHPLRADVAGSGARLRSFRHLVWYEEPGEHAASAHVRPGMVEPELIPLSPDSEAYLCGPIPFMRTVRAALRERGLPAERIHYEVFGSGVPVTR
ncbi:globin domain-containing protein [Dactylosporangium darangshiense]|uniref:nitric oxide dioxygenase n=1 Tax=Dactylosporangium darangshiense TaxID=579108 RepID=A0ABP8DIA4_9ACTN